MQLKVQTRFIDELSKKVSSRDSRRLVISVSYNGYTRPFTELPIAVRVLFYALAAPSNTLEEAWKAFVQIPGVQSLTLRETLFALMEAAEAENVVLCVDEIIRSRMPSDCLVDLTSTMDAFRRASDPEEISRLSIFVTSLDGILSGEFSASGIDNPHPSC